MFPMMQMNPYANVNTVSFGNYMPMQSYNTLAMNAMPAMNVFGNDQVAFSPQAMAYMNSGFAGMMQSQMMMALGMMMMSLMQGMGVYGNQGQFGQQAAGVPNGFGNQAANTAAADNYGNTANTAVTAGNNVPVNNANNAPVGDRPNGLQEIINTFGQPGTNQVTVPMAAGPGGKTVNVTCNAKIADKLKSVFDEIKAQGLSGCIHSFDGCYNNRNKRGGSTKSTHAWGIAVDINAGTNPMGSSNQTADQQRIAQIFAKYGFYQLPNDPMHFQYCTGY